MKIKALTAVLFCLFLEAFSEDKIIFADDFSKPQRLQSEWKFTDGIWRYDAIAQTLRQSQGAPHRLGKIYLQKPLPSNVEIQFDLTYLGGKSEKGFGAGLILRHPGVNKTGSFYQLGIATHGKSGITISIVETNNENGKLRNKYKEIAKFDTHVFEQNRKHRVKVSMEEKTFVCTIDGEEMFEYQLPQDMTEIQSSIFGLSTYGASVDFDNLLIRELR